MTLRTRRVSRQARKARKGQKSNSRIRSAAPPLDHSSPFCFASFAPFARVLFKGIHSNRPTRGHHEGLAARGGAAGVDRLVTVLG